MLERYPPIDYKNVLYRVPTCRNPGGMQMKALKSVVLAVMAGLVAGCSSVPSNVAMDSAFQHKVVTPCDNDLFCLRNNYSVTWDYKCTNCISDHSGYPQRMDPNYPVTYKNNEYIVETGSNGYQITMPSGGAVKN